MQQRQTLLLWKKHESIDTEFDSVFEQFISLLKVFSGYPSNLRPNFDTAWAEGKAKSIPVEREALYTYLKNIECLHQKGIRWIIWDIQLPCFLQQISWSLRAFNFLLETNRICL